MELNINQNVSDAFYRYKMPQLSAKVEGKGNGIKTVIVNVTDIAKRLYRKPIYVTKYFGCELGAQIHVDDKNDRYIVNGAHDTARLQELLFGFINKFVLCSNCGNPETTLQVKVKAGVVNTICTACGNRGQLDPRHRLTQFIIKNPPGDESAATEKRGKKVKKMKNGKDQQPEDDDQSPAGDDFRNSQSLSEDEDVDWGEDTTEEAQKRRLAELSDMARNLTVNADIEKTETERANMFFKLITQYKQAGDAVSRGQELRNEAQRLNLGNRSVLIVAEVLLSDPKTIVTDIKCYKPVFLQFTRVGDQQHKTQGYVLGAMASLIEKHLDELLPKACHILKALYDDDIVEEEVILSWFEKNLAKRYVSKNLAGKIADKCAPMLTWLREADTESDDDDGADAEQGFDGNETPAESSNSAEISPNPKQQKVDEVETDSGDDLDIDAI
ncbi:Eukaryotic translation initiation factor 5 [Echinococcus multilocularis]|uniref:Eukaryotic translation initiation factor 5 n=1 Tax=Echinococcus multilocularis TaxID=6211 RepID=A0A068XYN2_ECHMU|nr:Eukaryotic translation initiation factor 5 [Echinococcus multilocularis]